MTVAGSSALAIVAYLIPIAVVLLVRARRERSTWETALDVPFAVAVDLLSVLLLTLVVRLETAVLVSRPLWLAGGGALAWARKRAGTWGWPAALGWRDTLWVLAAPALAVLACSPISRNYDIWDTEWHIGLASALVGQRLPFINALSQQDTLHYHFTGDVLAGMLKVLSWQVISASRALHLAHDTMFALVGLTVALLVLGTRLTRGWPVALAGFCLLFHGPLPLRQGLGNPFWGYAYHAFFNLSYRPHYPVGMLMLVGAFGCVLFRVLAPTEARGRSTGPVLVATLTAASITDETSTALAGVVLGVAWLMQPAAVASTRRNGILLLALSLCSMLAANFVFHAALSPGTPIQKLTLSSDWRVGNILGSALPLGGKQGTTVFLLDSLPLLAGWLALLLHGVRARGRGTLVLCVASGALLVVGSALALRVQINDDHQEVHRFYVAMFTFSALASVACFGAMRPGSTERALVVLGVALPVVGQLYWALQLAPEAFGPWRTPAAKAADPFLTDCRTVAGAHFGEAARPAYVAPSDYSRFVGCRPVLSAGVGHGPWLTKIYPVSDPFDQLRILDKEMRDRSLPLDAVCPVVRAGSDPVCRRARERGSCKHEGTDYVRCQLSPDERRALLGGRWNG
jgi:hypothetical protein